MRRTLLCLALLSSASAGLPAQTFIVDAQGGPGSHYKDLAKAVAAVPSGAVLRVRDGSYPTPFSISNKSITIIGDSRAVLVGDRVTIGPLRASDRVLIARLKIHASGSFPPGLLVQNAAGEIVLHDVEINSGGWLVSTRAFSEFQSCANVQIWHGTFAGPVDLVNSSVQVSSASFAGQDGGWPLGNELSPMPAMRQSGGRLQLSSCSLKGGNGTWLVSCGFPRDHTGQHGEAAVRVGNQGALTLFRSTLTGGDGSRGVQPCSPAKNGGPAVSLAASTLLALGAGLAGGNGGAGGGQPGPPVAKDAGSRVTVDGKALPPVTAVTGTVAPGADIQLSVKGRPGSVALLLLGVDSTILDLAPVGVGHLYCIPSLILGQFVLPANGELRIPVRVPKGWPFNVATFGQFLTLEIATGSTLWGSSPFLLIAPSSSR